MELVARLDALAADFAAQAAAAGERTRDVRLAVGLRLWR